MRTPSSILTLLLATAAAGSAAGCHRQPTTEVSPNAATTVKVVNNNFSDVDVFAEGTGGARLRLGTVTGQSSSTFTLPPSYVAFGNIRLVGAPIGAFGTARSGKLQIAAGETIVFTVQPDLALSSATVEQP
jgi:hypothetical protein